MFEDDIDLDEILIDSESTNSLKRFNTYLQEETLSKRPKIDPVPLENNHENFSEICRNKVKEVVRNIECCEPIEDGTRTKVVNEPISALTTNCYQKKNFGSDRETQNSCSNNVHQYFEKHSVSRIENDSSNFKRRFPGPAGLLSEGTPNNSLLENLDDSSRVETKDEIYILSSCIQSNTQPWEEMLIDFKTEDVSLPEKYNIQWIKSRTKNLINQKTPFLAAFVDRIQCHSIQNPIVNVVLKDNTGIIQGTILHQLYEEHSSSLTVGSVVVLKDIAVLTTGPTDESCLAITPNNLVSIYSSKKKTVCGSSQFSNETSKTVLQNVSADEILNCIKEIKRKHELANMDRPTQSIPLMNKDMTGSEHSSDTCRKVIHNVKSSGSSKSQNLSVLEIKSTHSNSSVKSAKESVNSNVDNKEEIEDIRKFFDSKEDLDEFFNNEPMYCSTQKGTKDIEKSMETKTEVCSDDNPGMSGILEDMFEGVDANALFDEF